MSVELSDRGFICKLLSCVVSEAAKPCRSVMFHPRIAASLDEQNQNCFFIPVKPKKSIKIRKKIALYFNAQKQTGFDPIIQVNQEKINSEPTRNTERHSKKPVTVNGKNHIAEMILSQTVRNGRTVTGRFPSNRVTNLHSFQRVNERSCILSTKEHYRNIFQQRDSAVLDVLSLSNDIPQARIHSKRKNNFRSFSDAFQLEQPEIEQSLLNELGSSDSRSLLLSERLLEASTVRNLHDLLNWTD